MGFVEKEPGNFEKIELKVFLTTYTVFKKNTIATFTVTFYPVTWAVTVNGKYIVTPTVTVIIVTAF